MSQVMVVEDELVLSRAWSEVLRRRGHDVQCYATGLDALEHLGVFDPDLVIVDLGLPDMSGAQLVLEFRREYSQAKLPILVASGSQSEEAITEAFSAGATDYLVKPIRLSELIAKTSVLLSKSQKLQDSSLECPYYPGDVAFGAYRIDRELGRGSYGAVYLAQALESSQRAALKILSTASPSDRARFLRECYTLNAVQHPGVPRVLDYGELDGECYLAMEEIEGVDLASLVSQGGPLDEQSVLSVLSALADVLEHLETLQFVHRDLKPANVVLRGGRTTSPVLVDFGLAKHAADSGITLPGVMMGTPGYMAPEALECDSLDARADMFALGMLARYLLSGREIHPNLSGYPLLQLMASQPVDMAIGVSPATQALLEDLTRLDPSARLQPTALKSRLKELSGRTSG